MRIPKALNSPARISVVSFALLICIGTGLLTLPASTTKNTLGFIDALFTATSASCVTGLIVVDTGKDLALFGQIVVLALIQIGGIGIITFSTVFLLMAGRKIGLASRNSLQDTFTHCGETTVVNLVLRIVKVTFIIETIGAMLLFLNFVGENTVSHALYLAVFHAVSAFCNAGFSLFSDSFESFQDNWLINVALAFLIIAGGIGFLVLTELGRKRPFTPSGWKKLSLHSKIALSSCGILIFSGGVLFFAMEYDNTLADLSFSNKLLAAFFQSVTARTAGFNTLGIGHLANETLFMLLVLMFIGGSSGSCAGGIKTGTFATLMVLGLSRLRGHDYPQIFRRTIGSVSVARAASVVMVSLFVVVIAILLLQATELGGVDHVLTRGTFLELMFETVSAFGTVGLSTGVTGGLSDFGKITIILVMFVGRLGPLAIALAIIKRKSAHYKFAEETIMIG